MEATTERKIVGRECKHGTYVQAQDGTRNDAVFVKEYLHYDDGTVEPNLLMIENFKRPFWVTHPQFRNHKDKKFEESMRRVQKYTSTQIDLVRSIGRALGYQAQSLAMASQSPYVYGTDVSTPTIIKYGYSRRWPDYNGDKSQDNRIAALDAETDMFTDEQEPIMFSLTMRSQAFLVVVRSFFEGVPHPEQKIRAAVDRHIGDKIKDRNINLEIAFAEDAGDASYQLIMKAHEWKPDILNIWNVNFDMKKIIYSLEKRGYDLADVFSDPSVPKRYRYFKYVEGRSQKETASGKFMALHPAEQWHRVECPASFYVLDSMCVYLRLRIAGGKEPSYRLDAILKKHGCEGKFVFEPASHLTDGNWHRYMQENHKPEYCVYNLMDCIALEELDEVTSDLSRQITAMSGPSEYSRFSSQPRRTCDDLHFELLADNKVIGSTGRQMEEDNDRLTLGLKHWIVTLASHLMDDTGYQTIEEMPEYATKIFRLVADLDITGTYPNEQVILNIGRETTAKEVCKIQGLSERAQRAFGINLTGGYVNAVELCCVAMQAPTMDRLLKDFRAELAGVEPEPDPLSTLSLQMQLMMEEDVEASEDEDEDEEEDEDY